MFPLLKLTARGRARLHLMPHFQTTYRSTPASNRNFLVRRSNRGCGVAREKTVFKQGLRCIRLYELSVCDTVIPKYHLEGRQEWRGRRKTLVQRMYLKLVYYTGGSSAPCLLRNKHTSN